jgi:hypothetical protein
MASDPLPEESETPAPEASTDVNDADGTAPVAAKDDDLEADAIETPGDEPEADDVADDAEEATDEADPDAEPADELEADEEADTGDDEQVAKTLADARVKPAAKPAPAPKAKAEPAPEPDELEATIAEIEKEVDPSVAKVLKALHAQNKSLLAEKQAQSADSYNKMVHAAFDSMAAQGKHDIYGSHASGKLTPAQVEARLFVHEAANEKYQRFGGKKIGGKPYEWADAIDSAEREMMTLLGKASPKGTAKASPKQNTQAAAQARHKARTAVPRGSTVDRGSGLDDPNDNDGTAPPRK